MLKYSRGTREYLQYAEDLGFLSEQGN